METGKLNLEAIKKTNEGIRSQIYSNTSVDKMYSAIEQFINTISLTWKHIYQPSVSNMNHSETMRSMQIKLMEKYQVDKLSVEEKDEVMNIIAEEVKKNMKDEINKQQKKHPKTDGQAIINEFEIKYSYIENEGEFKENCI